MYILLIVFNFLHINGALAFVNTYTTEGNLRTRLFQNYSKYNRPIINFSENIQLTYGLEIKSLEYLDQKAENVQFNIWIIQTGKMNILLGTQVFIIYQK